MKLKNSLLVLALFSGLGVARAQDIEVHNGAQFKVTSLEFIETILEVNSSRSSFLTRAGLIANKFRILNLDAELNEASKFELELPKVENKKVKFFWAVQLEGTPYLFSRYFDNKANDYYMYASEIDPKTGSFKRHFEVMKVNDDKFSGLRSPFSAVRSIDSTKVCFITEYPVKNKENARYGFKVVKNDMSEVWSKDIEFPEESKNLTLIDYDVDKNGNIHFVAQIRMDREEKQDKGAKSRYYVSIFSYFHETGELKQYDIGFKDEIIRQIDLDVNENNELVGTGFYSERKLVESYKGFFYLRIDPVSKNVVASNLSPFSTELLTELIGARKAEKGKEMPPYIIRTTVPLSNGGMACVAEHYVYTRYEDSKGNVRESWLYGNAVVMFIDKEGKMTTAAVLKKKQYCTAVNGSPSLLQSLGVGMYPGVNELPYYGIAIMEVDDNIHILYNDDPRNPERINLDKNPKSVRQRTSVTNLVTFKGDGTMVSNVLFKSKDKASGYKMPLMPKSAIQYTDHDMIVFGRKGKTMRVTRVTVK